jgi:hypothetical protein
MTDLSDVDVNEEFIQKKIPLAQQYVMNPMLFHGHKITFRIYVAITSVDPLRIYVYPNGLARICSQEFVASRSPILLSQNHHLTIMWEYRSILQVLYGYGILQRLIGTLDQLGLTKGP